MHYVFLTLSSGKRYLKVAFKYEIFVKPYDFVAIPPIDCYHNEW